MIDDQLIDLLLMIDLRVVKFIYLPNGLSLETSIAFGFLIIDLPLLYNYYSNNLKPFYLTLTH